MAMSSPSSSRSLLADRSREARPQNKQFVLASKGRWTNDATVYDCATPKAEGKTKGREAVPSRDSLSKASSRGQQQRQQQQQQHIDSHRPYHNGPSSPPNMHSTTPADTPNLYRLLPRPSWQTRPDTMTLYHDHDHKHDYDKDRDRARPVPSVSHSHEPISLDELDLPAMPWERRPTKPQRPLASSPYSRDPTERDQETRHSQDIDRRTSVQTSRDQRKVNRRTPDQTPRDHVHSSCTPESSLLASTPPLLRQRQPANRVIADSQEDSTTITHPPLHAVQSTLRNTVDDDNGDDDDDDVGESVVSSEEDDPQDETDDQYSKYQQKPYRQNTYQDDHRSNDDDDDEYEPSSIPASLSISESQSTPPRLPMSNKSRRSIQVQNQFGDDSLFFQPYPKEPEASSLSSSSPFRHTSAHDRTQSSVPSTVLLPSLVSTSLPEFDLLVRHIGRHRFARLDEPYCLPPTRTLWPLWRYLLYTKRLCSLLPKLQTFLDEVVAPLQAPGASNNNGFSYDEIEAEWIEAQAQHLQTYRHNFNSIYWTVPRLLRKMTKILQEARGHKSAVGDLGGDDDDSQQMYDPVALEVPPFPTTRTAMRACRESLLDFVLPLSVEVLGTALQSMGQTHKPAKPNQRKLQFEKPWSGLESFIAILTWPSLEIITQLIHWVSQIDALATAVLLAEESMPNDDSTQKIPAQIEDSQEDDDDDFVFESYTNSGERKVKEYTEKLKLRFTYVLDVMDQQETGRVDLDDSYADLVMDEDHGDEDDDAEGDQRR